MPDGPEVIILVLKGSYDPPGSMGPIEPHGAQRAPYAPYEPRGGTLEGLISPWGPTIKCMGGCSIWHPSNQATGAHVGLLALT